MTTETLQECCPKCGKEPLDGDQCIAEGHIVESFHCPECGCEWENWFKAEYSFTEVND